MEKVMQPVLTLSPMITLWPLAVPPNASWLLRRYDAAPLRKGVSESVSRPARQQSVASEAFGASK